MLEADIQCLARAGSSANAVCSCASIPSMGVDKVLEHLWRTDERRGCKEAPYVIAALGISPSG